MSRHYLYFVPKIYKTGKTMKHLRVYELVDFWKIVGYNIYYRIYFHIMKLFLHIKNNFVQMGHLTY